MVPPNPYTKLFEMQMALFDGWMRTVSQMMACLCTSMEHNGKLFEHPHCRWHDVTPQDADLQGKYGHRSTDVDVERI